MALPHTFFACAMMVQSHLVDRLVLLHVIKVLISRTNGAPQPKLLTGRLERREKPPLQWQILGKKSNNTFLIFIIETPIRRRHNLTLRPANSAFSRPRVRLHHGACKLRVPFASTPYTNLVAPRSPGVPALVMGDVSARLEPGV